MTRIRLVLSLATVALALVAVSASQASTIKLVGTVGPGYTIHLTKAGRAVKVLKPGRYAITVRDRSGNHDFHLLGRGVDKMTTIPFVGTVHWTVTLRKGTYKFQCDPHVAIPSMHGAFTVR